MMKRIYAKVILGTLFCVLTMISSCADAARYDADAPEILYFGRWEEDEGVRRCGRGDVYQGGLYRRNPEGGPRRRGNPVACEHRRRNAPTILHDGAGNGAGGKRAFRQASGASGA